MQHLISARTRATAVTNAAATIGVGLPSGFLEQLALAQAFPGRANETVCTTPDLLDAVLACIEQGRDYHNDKNVQRLALNHQLTQANVLARARSRGEELLAAALADWADRIVAGWSAALDKHAAHLAAAAQAGLNLSDADAVVAKGGDNMVKLHNAQIAVKAWAAATHGFAALAAAAGIPYSGSGELALTAVRKAELEAADEMARDEGTRDIDAWTLVRSGVPLKLAATLGEFRKRVATYTADAEAEARAEAKRRQEAGFNTR
jgi:hypothetical protein